MWENKESISTNIDQIKRDLSQYQFKISRVPHAKIIEFFKFRDISLLIDRLLRLILKKECHKKKLIIKQC